ncbi:MAG: 30S ribosomal protein S17e [Candidatus Bathyarchaeia archaeon]
MRPALVKRMAKLIFEKYGDQVSVEFDKNKELVAKVLGIESKFLRNSIAGYLTSYAKRFMKTETVEEVYEEEVEGGGEE